MIYEIIGLIASVFIILSMSFVSTDTKSNIKMRIFNMIGSLIFVIYGLLIPAYSTSIVNFFMIVVNLYNIYKLKKIKQEV